jgi:Flp pilus assembly protein TadB
MTLVASCALLASLGLVLVARAAFPRRPSLSTRLDDLLAPPRPASAPPPSANFLDGVSEGLWAGLDPDGRRFPKVAADLAVMGRSPSGLVRQLITTAAAFVALAAVVGLAIDVAGLHLAPVVLIWSVLVAGAAGALVPVPSLKVDAARRRDEMCGALAVVCDLAALLVAAGEDLDGAVIEATAVGAGWAFDALRQSLAATSLSRQGPWAGLGELGERLGVDELLVLAQNMALAGEEGAKIRDALATQARALREEAAAEVKAKAGSVTERMSFPMVLLLVGFILVIGYPATSRL